MKETLGEIGEIELLNRLKSFVPKGQIDDDTAQVNTLGKDLLINTDVLVEGVHFSDKTTSPEDVGWKAISTNFSDLICSGVNKIIGVTIGLITPPDTTWEWVEKVYKGMDQAMNKYGGNLLGGDCSKGTARIISVTAIGTLGPIRLHRSYAKPGDYLVTSGPHGLSRLGLALLLSDPLAETHKLSEDLKSKAIHAHQKPHAPLDALQALEKCKPKDIPWRAAGTDSSDGLLEAIQGICRSSRCKAVLDPFMLPKNHDWPTGNHWDDWCLNGGEDYELILSMPPSWAKALLQSLPNSKQIGMITNGAPIIEWCNNSQEINVKSDFKHF